jgi:hypothetical protein
MFHLNVSGKFLIFHHQDYIKFMKKSLVRGENIFLGKGRLSIRIGEGLGYCGQAGKPEIETKINK